MDNNLLIKNAFNYYDNKLELYEHLLSKIHRYELIPNNLDLEKNIIKFFDKSNNFIFKANFEDIGTYFNKTKLWVWSWAYLSKPRIQTNAKNKNFISRMLLNYGLDINLDNNNTKINKDIMLKELLINSRLIITTDTNLNILLYIILYISKKEFVYKNYFQKEKDPVSYIFLFNIKTKD